MYVAAAAAAAEVAATSAVGLYAAADNKTALYALVSMTVRCGRQWFL